MGRLTGPAIRQAVLSGAFVAEPYVEGNVGPTSIDLRLGSRVLVFDKDQELSTRWRPVMVDHPFRVDEWGRKIWKFVPGVLYLAATREWVALTGLCGIVFGRSSMARYGVTVESAGFVDDGFRGQLTLEIQVVHPIEITEGERVCQLALDTLTGDRQPYCNSDGHHYNDSVGPVPPHPLG